MKPELSKEYIDHAHNVEQLSLREIAQRVGTYPNKIRRFAMKNDVHIRDKSEAQTVALETGRHTHPTKGKVRPDDVKAKISDKMAENWAALSEEEYQERVRMGREAWENMSEIDRQFIMRKAGDAIRRTSREGSKMEHALKEALTNAGFVVEFHKEGLIPNFKLQIDLFIPELSTAIEVDGPSHFLPIWGQDNFQRNQRADKEKTGLITSAGMTLIRIKCMSRNISGKTIRNAVTSVLEQIKDIQKNDKRRRVIEIEV